MKVIIAMIVAICSSFIYLTGESVFANNNVASNAKNMVTDSAITAAVKSVLLADTSTSSSNINVTTNNGVVTLSGTVQNADAADVAIEKAEAVQGVKDVNSKLVVKTGDQPVTDSVITAKVKGLLMKEKIFGDQDISVTGVNVETKKGVVYLTGDQITREQMKNVRKIAKSVSGVKRVVVKFNTINQ